MSIGQNIRKIRKEKGITQKKLSELCGIAEVTIRKYEAEKFIPKVPQVERIAKGLDVSPFDIMGVDYWDTTIDTGQLAKEVSALDSVGSAYGEDAVQLLSDFLSLNDTGKRKAAEYVSDLTEQPKYKK